MLKVKEQVDVRVMDGLEQGFLTSALVTFGTKQFFVVRGCPVQCGKFRSILGLHSPNAGRILFLKALPNVSYRVKLPPVENHWPRIQVSQLPVNLPRKIIILIGAELTYKD